MSVGIIVKQILPARADSLAHLKYQERQQPTDRKGTFKCVQSKAKSLISIWEFGDTKYYA